MECHWEVELVRGRKAVKILEDKKGPPVEREREREKGWRNDLQAN